ncbi:putative ribonuclease H-like domain-containing protein [Tanacetum coccineum]
MWRLRIEQYFQIQDYALWDIIENGNSFNPVARTTTNADGTSTLIIRGPVTTKEKVQKKNDVKARSMLLMALPNEHQMTFNQYKDAKTLFEAIQTRFGGNDATKKTQKILLKHMLQKIVSQLAILGENISQEDLNLKFLRILPSEWNTHVVVWRNKPDLDSMSFDDLYNNFKIVEQEVKGTVTSSSNSGSQNVAFVSTPSSTNEVNTANVYVSTASSIVSTDSTHDNTANLSDATVYAFLANQPNGSQLVHEDLEQIHEDDLEEMDLKWQLALLSMRARKYYQRTGKKITINGSDTAGYEKSKVECFNCHKLGHFSKECRGPRNQESMARNQDSSRRTVNVEYISSKAKFWKTVTVDTINDGEQQLTVIVDEQTIVITEASVMRHLQLADADGISSLPNTKIFDQLTLMGYVSNDDKLTFQKGSYNVAVRSQSFGAQVKIPHRKEKGKDGNSDDEEDLRFSRILPTREVDRDRYEGFTLQYAAKILADASREKVKTYIRRRSTDSSRDSTAGGLFSTAEEVQGKERYDEKKPLSVAQARKNMMIYLKNMAGYKMGYFKGMSYDEIRPIFEEEYNKIQTLFKKDTEVEKTKTKRITEEDLFKKVSEVQGF